MRIFAFIFILLAYFPIFGQGNTAATSEEPMIIGSIYEPNEPDQANFEQVLMMQNEELAQSIDSLIKEIEVLTKDDGSDEKLAELEETIQMCKEIMTTNYHMLEGKAKIKAVLSGK